MHPPNFVANEFDPKKLPQPADSSDVDTDMSPAKIQKRLQTMGQLSRLASYLAQGKVIGKAEDNYSGAARADR